MAAGTTPWQRPGFSLQDLEPAFSREGDLVRPLSLASIRERQFGLGTMGDGSIAAYRYVGPDGIGRHLVSPPEAPDTVVTLPGPDQAFFPGEFVMVGRDRAGGTIIGKPPSGRIGASGFTDDTPPEGVVEDFKVTSIEADPLVAEATDQPITLRGYGLRDGDSFQAVIYNEETLSWDPDPLVTLHDATNISGEETSILADLAPGVPPTYPIRVLYRRT